MVEIKAGLLVCLGGFFGGLAASTLWVLNTTGVVKLFGLVLILTGIGACAYVLPDNDTANTDGSGFDQP